MSYLWTDLRNRRLLSKVYLFTKFIIYRLIFLVELCVHSWKLKHFIITTALIRDDRNNCSIFCRWLFFLFRLDPSLLFFSHILSRQFSSLVRAPLPDHFLLIPNFSTKHATLPTSITSKFGVLLITFPEWTIFFCTASLIRCLLVALIFSIVVLVFRARWYRWFNMFSLWRWYFVGHILFLWVKTYLLGILAIILIIIVTISTVPIELF